MKISIFKKDASLCRWLLLSLLVMYFLLLTWVIIFKCNVNDQLHLSRNSYWSIIKRLSVNAIPFYSTVKAIIDGSVIGIVEFFFNLIVFIPFGVFLRFFASERATLIAAGITTFSVEVFQLFTGWGGPDPTDLIMNFGGALIGVWIYRALRPKIKDNIINILSFSASAVALPLSVFAIINTVIHFPVV